MAMMRLWFGGIGSLFGGVSGLGMGAGMSGFAYGGVLDNGRVQSFAAGGIIDSPTVFPMARGLGLAGESGPEAIMPLKRGPGGRLGVESTGGGTVINIGNYIERLDAIDTQSGEMFLAKHKNFLADLQVSAINSNHPIRRIRG